MLQPSNSPLPDSGDFAYGPPPVTTITEEDAKAENQFASLGSDTKRYAEVVKYVETRKEFWRHYLPGNVPIEEVNFKNWHEFDVAQKTAANMITELDALIGIIEVSRDAVQRSRG
jgi:hypothetical protein